MALVGRSISVPVGYNALDYRDGEVQRVLGPGRHRVRDERTIVTVPVRERLLAVAPQEITTAESVTIRVSMTLRIKVIDPVAYVERAAEPDAVVYLAAQIALRDIVVGVAVVDVLRRGDAIDVGPIARAARTAGSDVGIEVLAVVVKDVVVPHEIRSAALELMTAKARGAARLEEARAETTSLRALANAGRMLDASPALASLRMIQAAPPGSKVVIAVGGDVGRPGDAD
ncbi:SPFH domain-containing protein [Tsukamurella soli]|uniref:Slipin family protein n=1 Tax=Tsukamurella soli TaxID=644556 RepID=A0ABP8JY17_9ACTN